VARCVPKKEKGRKYFFFEKKKQKTFAPLVCAPGTIATHTKEQKFFGSFFQKRTASLLLDFGNDFGAHALGVVAPFVAGGAGDSKPGAGDAQGAEFRDAIDELLGG
jgi:hypothetical protein